MYTCKVCNSTDFYKEAGYFFCQICQTQNENIREEILELRIDSSTRLRKTRIRQLRSNISGEELGWTSWELYNFILIGLTNELIELGVTPDIKLTILQLWAMYLRKIEVAFLSTRKKSIPKLARRYKKRDAEIIYGKVQIQKKYRKRKRAGSSTNTSMISSFQSEGSSGRELNRNKRLLVAADYDRYLQSQASTEVSDSNTINQSMCSSQSGSVMSSNNEGKVRFSSHAREETKKIKRLSKNIPRYKRAKYKASHISTQYKMGPHVITPMKLWAIIYLALRIHNDPIQLGDMLRYAREGHLSYYKLDHLLPPEVSATKIEKNFLSQSVEITHKGMRRIITSMAKFLGVWNIIRPDFLPLVNRYCQELALPRGVQLYTERLIALSSPKMIFNSKTSCFPNYEGRVMAFIILVLKILFALDGITEYQISRIADKINSGASNHDLFIEKLFSFYEWQKYIECRKTILTHAHFPTQMKYNPELVGIDDLYVKFLEFVSSKTDNKESVVKSSKHFLPEELISAMTKHISSLSINDVQSKTVQIFAPSLTPLHSYLQQLLDHPQYDIPNLAQTNFFCTKVGYITKPNLLRELATQNNIELEIIDSNLHFFEKIVPPFEPYKMPSIEELKQLVNVEDHSMIQNEIKSENLNDYLHAKVPCRIKFDSIKEQYYDNITNTTKEFKDIEEESDFTFTEILPNGKLAIPVDNVEDEEEEKEREKGILKDANVNRNFIEKLNNTFCKKHNLCLSSSEKESIKLLSTTKDIYFKQQRPKLTRNAKGQFIKNPRKVKRRKMLNNLSSDSSTHLNTTNEIHDTTPKDIHADIQAESTSSGINNSHNLSEISMSRKTSDFTKYVPNDKSDTSNEKYQFFRPFKEYWMYHCIFSRVKPKNFTIFERALPRTFRWLLNECALIVEMSMEDLYEEVCLIETYCAHILKPPNSENDSSDDVNTISKNQLNLILSKW